MKSSNLFSSERLSFKRISKAQALRILCAIGVALAISQIHLDFVESYLYDLRVRGRLISPQPQHVELVYIRPSTVQRLNGLPQAHAHNELLLKILAQKPLAIVYDFKLEEVAGAPEAIKEWQKTILSHSDVYVATDSTPLKGQEAELYLKKPYDKVRLTPAPKTADIWSFAQDKVSRRLLLNYQGSPMLQVQLAAKVNPDVLDPQKVRGRFYYYETDQAYIDFSRKGDFGSQLFENILDGKSLRNLEGKIVLIGTDLDMDETQYVLTPFDRKTTALPRIELQGNVIETLIRNSGPIKSPPWVNWILTAIAALVTVNVVLTSKPSHGLMVIGGMFVTILVTAYFAFWPFGIWLPIAHSLLAIFLCYYFFIPYRLIVENRRSWEYYQKNKLLSQVEELKTNFISMMSHDLKTPIARIQGMTDVILTDSAPISSQQREAVDTIRHSSDDLLKFINAILSYGRIESEGVQLQLQSRDVNQLLKDVIRKHEFLAKIKRIQILPELEPLFPIQVDPELIKQVLSNLVENAIKYSPEDTKILITTEERDNKIVIQVADQGAGIPPDELANIFTKFFRSKNAKSSPIKGSGLGLYLAKYFTELHSGSIFVESSIGNGSTFTVELPMEQGGLNA